MQNEAPRTEGDTPTAADLEPLLAEFDSAPGVDRESLRREPKDGEKPLEGREQDTPAEEDASTPPETVDTGAYERLQTDFQGLSEHVIRQQDEADQHSVMEWVQEGLGELQNRATETDVARYLESLYHGDEAFKAAWDGRYEDDKAWSAALYNALDGFREELSTRPIPDGGYDVIRRQIASAALAAGSSPTTVGGEYPDFSGMADREFQIQKRDILRHYSADGRRR